MTIIKTKTDEYKELIILNVPCNGQESAATINIKVFYKKVYSKNKDFYKPQFKQVLSGKRKYYQLYYSDLINILREDPNTASLIISEKVNSDVKLPEQRPFYLQPLVSTKPLHKKVEPVSKRAKVKVIKD